MGRKKLAIDQELKHQVCTRVNDQKFRELSALLDRNPSMDMSTLVRHILHNRQIKVFTRDMTLDNLMEELARLRGEIRAIGVNINQMTKQFNTFPEWQRKELFARMGFHKYQDLQPKVDQLLAIIGKLAKKWLSE
jgi:hypothetical protein